MKVAAKHQKFTTVPPHLPKTSFRSAHTQRYLRSSRNRDDLGQFLPGTRESVWPASRCRATRNLRQAVGHPCCDATGIAFMRPRGSDVV